MQALPNSRTENPNFIGSSDQEHKRILQATHKQAAPKRNHIGPSLETYTKDLWLIEFVHSEVG